MGMVRVHKRSSILPWVSFWLKVFRNRKESLRVRRFSVRAYSAPQAEGKRAPYLLSTGTAGFVL